MSPQPTHVRFFDWKWTLDGSLPDTSLSAPELAVLGNALVAAQQGCSVSYTRNRNRWFEVQPGCPFSLRALCNAVASLEEAGWIQHTMGFHDRTNTGKGYQSHFSASPKLLLKARAEKLQVVKARPQPAMKPSVVWDIGEEGRRALYTNTTPLPHLSLTLYQEALTSFALEGSTRVFHQDEQQGWEHGRFYNAAQTLPKAVRKHITVNGEPTTELDFKSTHPTMLYHLEGLTAPSDAYACPSLQVDRDVLKWAFQMLLNSKSRTSAALALSSKLQEEKLTLPQGTRPVDVLDALANQHAPIKGYFFSLYGKRLMTLDAQIAELVLGTLSLQHIACLPIHDSFLVATSHKEALRAAMLEAWKRIVQTEQAPEIKELPGQEPTPEPLKASTQVDTLAIHALTQRPFFSLTSTPAKPAKPERNPKMRTSLVTLAFLALVNLTGCMPQVDMEEAAEACRISTVQDGCGPNHDVNYPATVRSTCAGILAPASPECVSARVAFWECNVDAHRERRDETCGNPLRTPAVEENYEGVIMEHCAPEIEDVRTFCDYHPTDASYSAPW